MRTSGVLVMVVAAGCRIGFDEVAHGGSDASGTPAPIEFLQQNGGWGGVGTTTQSITLTSDVGAGHALIAVEEIDNLSVTVTSITDSQGNAYAQVGGPSDAFGIRFSMWIATSTHAGPTAVTATFSAVPGNAGELFVAEYSGIATADPIDTVGFTSGGSFGLDQMAGTLSIAGARELVFGYGVGPCVKQGTAMTLRTDIHGDITEDRIVDAGAQTITATASCPATTDHWELMAGAFKPELQ